MGKIVKKELVNNVEKRVGDLVKENRLDLPKNYSLGNAMNSAWLKLQETKTKNKKPVLQACTKNSIANSLLDMAVQGLNPGKDQGYFLAYGNKLNFQRSYLGTVSVAKRVANIKDVVARVIYEGDDFKYSMQNGDISIEKHSQKFGNRKKENAIGAYCVIKFDDEREDYIELMTLDEIEDAWSQGQVFKKDKKQDYIPHSKFKTEMMKKTVTSRACKKYINSSNDNAVVAKAFNRSEINEAEQETEEEYQKANSQDIEDALEPDSVEDGYTNDQINFANKLLKSHVFDSDREEWEEKIEKTETKNGMSKLIKEINAELEDRKEAEKQEQEESQQEIPI